MRISGIFLYTFNGGVRRLGRVRASLLSQDFNFLTAFRYSLEVVQLHKYK